MSACAKGSAARQKWRISSEPWSRGR